MTRSFTARILSLPWGLVGGLRNVAYDAGLLPSRRPPIPVVCVGNISLGGTGKSPLVCHLACELRDGRVPPLLAGVLKDPVAPAILSRGYGRSTRGYLLASAGGGPLAEARHLGDEPHMFATICPGVQVAVCEKRSEGAARLAAQGAGLVILDDGFQHRSIRRDLDILVWDCNLDPAREALLPFGRLRESPAAARRAGALVLSRPEITGLAARRLDWFAECCPSFREKGRSWVMRSRFAGLVAPEGSTLAGGAVSGSHERAGSAGAADPGEPAAAPDSYGVFCGVGNPDQFLAALRENLGRSRWSGSWPDHHWFDSRDLVRLREAARRERLEALVTTWKDAVRLPAGHGLPLLVAEQEIELLPAQNYIESHDDQGDGHP